MNVVVSLLWNGIALEFSWGSRGLATENSNRRETVRMKRFVNRWPRDGVF